MVENVLSPHFQYVQVLLLPQHKHWYWIMCMWKYSVIQHGGVM